MNRRATVVAAAVALALLPIGPRLDAARAPHGRAEARTPVDPEPGGSRDELIRERIRLAVSIIDRVQWDQVVTSPFLVSALYYSPKAIAAMRDAKAGPARIVAAIYPRITKDFRDKYVSWLDAAVREARPEKAAEDLASPLATFSYVSMMNRAHRDAIDLVTPEGTPVMSMSPGMVVLAENGWQATNDLSTSSEMGGNTVIVYDSNTHTFFRYAHLRQSTATPGAAVSTGDPIGIVGHSGKRALRTGHGKHLHLEMNRWDAETGAMISVGAQDLKAILNALPHARG